MNPSLPNAKSAHFSEERSKIKRLVAERGLCGVANDTKWDEFINAVRARSWHPSYRYKCLDGSISRWDVEWSYHLPFPFISVEWFDVASVQEEKRHRLVATTVKDHSPWIEAILAEAGLDYAKGKTMIRIFGYSPRNMELFDE
jgi:hypothetical protein